MKVFHVIRRATIRNQEKVTLPHTSSKVYQLPPHEILETVVMLYKTSYERLCLRQDYVSPYPLLYNLARRYTHNIHTNKMTYV